MKSNIFIPKTINVGYVNRSDTYTKKLAYIIYYDEKNVLRKEKSWESWRDKNIPNDEFENVPISGFVLNKKVGDYDNGWNHRQAYTRVYDPRNFEFEITIENLLYILENTNSIKGKGLEGEFVYGWDGTELVLIPVESPDYKQITEYNSIVHNNESIKAKDLIIGATYLTKDNQEMIYIGKFNYYSSGYEWTVNGEVKRSKNYYDCPQYYNSYGNKNYKYINNLLYGKYFWFVYNYDYDWVDGKQIYKNNYKWCFNQFKSINNNKFIKCIDENCTSEYANIFEKLEELHNYSPYDKSKDKLCDFTLKEFIESGFYSDGSVSKFNFISNSKSYIADNNYKTKKHDIKKYESDSYNYINPIVYENVDLKEIYEIMKPQYIQEYLENGKEYQRRYKL